MFFCEPSMFAILIFFAIMFRKIYCKKNIFMEIVLIFTLLTTTSSNGIILMIIFYFLYYMFKNKNKKLKVLLLPIVLFIVSIVIIEILNEKISSNSGITRIDDILACLKTWREYPIFGCGYLNNQSIISNISSFRKNNQGISSSFFIILAQGGVYFLSIYIYAFFKILQKLRKSQKKEKIILIIMYILAFITTAFQYTMISLNIISLGIVFAYFYKQKRD